MRRRIRRLISVGVGTFTLSVLMNLGSTTALRYLALWPSIILLAFIISIGIIFDIIGVAATAASESPFHAMAVDKIHGAYQAIWLVRNADKVSSFCNDVVGDIAGTLSGAVGAAIVFSLTRVHPELPESLLTTFIVALAAAATVGGKASAKSLAIEKSDQIILLAGRAIYAVESITGLKLVRVGKNRSRRRGHHKRGNQ